MTSEAARVIDPVPCCAPVTSQVVSEPDAVRLAQVFKALGDPSRVRLLSLVATGEGGEACLCDLTEAVGLSQPTVSHHMKQLVSAGLVTREQRGRWAYYRVNEAAMTVLGDALRPG